MLNRRFRVSVLCLALSLAIASFATGCGALKKKPAETETETETNTETESETETETETETELETDVAYTSQDKSIRITLPDSTWKVTQDVDEMRVFSSGAAAMISIVHADGESELRNILVSVAESEEDLTESLTKQYAESNAFEVEKFEKLSSDTLETCEYVVKYNSTSMWAYAVTYAIIAEDEAYVITGTVTDDNKVLLEAVKKSVESFTALTNTAFTALPGTVVNQKTTEQSESESESNVDTELKSLAQYGTTATLYASDIVNVRQKPSTDADVLTTLSTGDQVTVTGETSQWFQVNISGNTGYISKAYLVSTKPVTQTETSSQSSDSSNAELNNYYDYGTGYTYYTTTAVNLRSLPGTDSAIMNSLDGGQAVTVVGETPNWYVVSVNGATGYISKSYISSTNTVNNTNNNDGEPNTNGGTSTTPVTGTVSGTIVDASMNTITIEGDDGNTYILDTSDATISTSDGVYTGLYVAATVDYSNYSGGAITATSVTGY